MITSSPRRIVTRQTIAPLEAPSGSPDVLSGAAGPDALLPPQMAAKAEAAGVRKADLPRASASMLGVLGGAYIALGAMFTTTVLSGGEALPHGIRQLLAGLVFSLGLILVVVGGAELFTGNTLLVMPWAGRRLRAGRVAANWTLVYFTNFAGAVATAGLVFLAGQYLSGGGAVGRTALAIAQRKSELGFIQAIAAGILCNALVCLAVWLSYSARSTTDRIVAIVLPVAAFVAAGFEHSIANMYFLPLALFIKAWAPASFWLAIDKVPADFASITWTNFAMANLVPVTIGNIIGGGLMVGGVYWFAYLRGGREGARN